ncbi:3-methyl-2-oxobutanoate hydroxymethyltransferase [Roseofilum sp. BLCC_M154]|uniref:3-methyl-2-oxobutanoate hydroxymethyltransferase n=1 Tax=Roseofilum acuticapitatum BLCC-M154 TaxID=3022444 RepID=A0ABT7AXK8_9CYAN|nr:3-methyl-2-oxobutanoate hydroxymethyltransferase [Roseofilum acuticapitatum]MDJ1171590.1 3-methyl-2-oxobutanoate hydroxymethyltransferase [Roseofilum acuticapitatum BLCC-M154]
MAIAISQLVKRKRQGHPLVMLTAWDYPFAQLLDLAGVDLILVGDSLAMVALGHPTTLPVTLDQMIYHTQAVCRGVKQAFVVCDLPFMSYQEGPIQALRSAGRVLKETQAGAVKLEGGYPEMIEVVQRLSLSGIPVVGHVGVTPQSVHRQGYRRRGKEQAEGDRILQEAIALAEAGAFTIILENITHDLAQKITETLPIPTIGIGAGPHCDGQVLVTSDVLGLSSWQPPFAKVYTNLQETITDAVKTFSQEVRDRQFP